MTEPDPHLMGGVAWPSHKTKRPGWACTLAVTFPEDEPKFKVESCYSSLSAVDLATWVSKQSGSEWYADLVDKAVLAMTHERALPVSPAPYLDAKDPMALYLQILHECQDQSRPRPILFFRKGLEITPAAKEQQQTILDDRANVIQDFPALAALVYVVSAAYLWVGLEKQPPTPTPEEWIHKLVLNRHGEHEPWAVKFGFASDEEIESERYTD